MNDGINKLSLQLNLAEISSSISNTPVVGIVLYIVSTYSSVLRIP